MILYLKLHKRKNDTLSERFHVTKECQATANVRGGLPVDAANRNERGLLF